MKNKTVPWDSEPPQRAATLEETEHFVARGMKPVYGRCDIFSRCRTFHMDIWKDKNDRLFMRLWSRNINVDWISYEINSIDLSAIPVVAAKIAFVEDWIPKVVRDVYDEWIQGEF